MPRNYIRKKIKTYTPQDLAEAIEKVKNGQLTQYGAAQQYNIPMTTLHDHITEKTANFKPTAGRPTVIPLEDEKKLAEAIVVMEKWGFGLSRLEIMDIVSDYVRTNNIQTPFKNNIPGPDWFINFRKRHRLSIKKAQSVEFVRRKMTDPFVIAEYFDILENVLKDLNLFESPQAIWNLDETSMSLDPSRTKVVGKINKPCARTTHGTGKENITVLTGASASGKKLPPLIVFKGKYVWDQWMAELDPDNYDFELSYAASTKGWMETDIFYNYFEKVLIPNLGEQRPVLVVYDGHSTHVDVRVVQLAVQNHVTILKLPPHTSHLLQPMDIAVFKSFKTIWDAKLVDWQRRNVGTKMPKNVFAQTLADTWQQTESEVIKSGFKKAGIYPFNAHVIPVDKYDPDAYKRYQKKISEVRLSLTSLLNPKSLKEICMDFFNNLSTTYIAHEAQNNDEVTLLSKVLKSDMQTLGFTVQHSSQIPTCLRNSTTMQNQPSQNTSKIRILSNIIIKEAFKPSPQPQSPPKLSCPFEELVLRKIQQDKKNATLTKKRRVTKGAEVITAIMGNKILEEIEKTRSTKQRTKTRKNIKKQPTKDNSIYTAQNQDEQSGPSGIKIKSKRKREPSLDTITSVSDIMSEHSDSDIVDVSESMEFEFEEIKCSQEKTNNSGSLSVKGKGFGKKSKGKENEMNIKNKEKEEKLIESDIEDDIDMFKISKNIETGEDPKDQTNKKHTGIGEERFSEDADLFMMGKNMKTRNTSKNKMNKQDKGNKYKKYFDSNIEDDADLHIIGKNIKKILKDKAEEQKSQVESEKGVFTGLQMTTEEYSNTKDKEKNEDIVHETQVGDNPIYNLNDSVLIRYLIRNKWKYYIGLIEEIIHHEQISFSINFFKTVKKQQQLVFVMPKKKDSDNVPEQLIVKKINMRKSNEKEYSLCNNEDTIYFN